jgi:hypothetical protein
MAFGNESKDYAKTTGRTGFYACHAPAYREIELKPETAKTEEPKKETLLGVPQTEIADVLNDRS